MLGRLSVEALPFYSAVAAGGAALTVAAALAVLALVTWRGAWGWLWRDWLTSVDHKRIAVMYVILALVMLVRGFIDALMMRLQQATALGTDGYLSPDHFDQVFSSHGTIMIIFMAMPFLTGLINLVVPLQIGARDVAFPRLNAVSLWLTAAGAGLVMASLVLGRFSTAGWTGYPPYSGAAFSPWVGVDYWIWAVLVAGVGSTLTGINFVVTIVHRRAPGMTPMRMPLFVWTALATSVLMIFAFPGVTVAAVLLALDRTFGMHFFTADAGGNMMMYANLLWIWGHPEVYILILPAFGIYSSVATTFAGRRLFGYASLVWATMAIALLSFTVWLHHFFTMGSSANVNAAFGIATMVIAVPTGVKVFDWLFTLWRGRIRLEVPMLYLLAFLVTFVIGGVSGVLLALPPADYLMHNSTFLVAHFHNMLIPGALFGYLAGLNLWFPKAFGFRLDARWGRRSFWCWVIGFYLAFMPLYALGFMGMPRRMEHYDTAAWQPFLLVAAAGAAFVLAALVCQAAQLIVSVRRRDALRDTTGDPWDGMTLEWATASPPPPYNFARLPEVRDRDAFLDMKLRGEAAPPGPYEDIAMQKPSAFGIAAGALAFLLGFGMVWHMWWLAVAAGGLIVLAVIVLSSDDDEERVLPAAEVARIEARKVSDALVQMRRDDERAFGFWLWLMSDAIVFALLFATYAVLVGGTAGGPGPPDLFSLPRAFAETLLLLLSSATFAFAFRAAEARDPARAIALLALTAALGAGFLALELAHRGMAASGAGPGRSGFLSAFFTLVGAHGLHVAAGLVGILTMIGQLVAKGPNPPVLSRLHRLGLFWHFLDIVWIGIFSVVYLPGVLA